VKTRLLSWLGETLINNAITLQHALCLKLNLSCSVLCLRVWEGLGVSCVRADVHAAVCISWRLLEHGLVSRTGPSRSLFGTQRSRLLYSIVPLSPGEPRQARKQTDTTYLCMAIDWWQHKRHESQMLWVAKWSLLSSVTADHSNVSNAMITVWDIIKCVFHDAWSSDVILKMNCCCSIFGYGTYTLVKNYFRAYSCESSSCMIYISKILELPGSAQFVAFSCDFYHTEAPTS